MNIESTYEQKSLFGRFYSSLMAPFSQHRWIGVAFVLLVVAVLTVAALEPQHVLAQVQQWLGYVPGIGFVEFTQARLLAAPVEVRQDGVTVRVSSVVAQEDKTVVVFASQGLPLEDEEASERSFSHANLEMTLQLPDGSLLKSETWHLDIGAGTIEFPPLPADIYRVSLHLSDLPLVAEGTAPQNWSFPLVLQPATGDLVAEAYPEPYSPADVSDTQDGITVRLLSVVHAPGETLLELQGEWTEADWEFFHFGHLTSPSLQDNVGHLYYRRSPSNSGSFSRVVVSEEETVEGERHFSQKETIAFAPVSLAAQHLSLELPEVELDVPASGSFELDLGDNPQVGDYWPLDIELEVAEVPVHITGVRVEEERQASSDESQEQIFRLIFHIEPFPAEAKRSLGSLELKSSPPNRGGGRSYDFRMREIQPNLKFEKIPSGKLKIDLTYASVIFHGPWQLEWSLPDMSAAENVQPVTLQPECNIQRHHGVALCIEEVTLTDRLTSVKVRAEEIPAETTFDIHAYEHEAYLTDDRGNRYDYLSDYAWQSQMPPFSDHSQLPFFAPLSTLATNATLHLPEVALTLPDSYSFEVTVPEDIPIHSNRAGIKASETWPISIPVELADYRLRFTEAQMIENGLFMMLELISEPFTIEEGAYPPKYLHISSISPPNGQTRTIDALSEPLVGERAYIWEQEDGTFNAKLFFDVTDPVSKSIMTGPHQVNLSHVTVVVPGAWELSWVLRGR